MKKQNFQQSLLAVGVITALGLSATAIAATTGDVSPDTNPTVKNQATATYNIDGVEQPEVKSNEVTVTVAPVAKFSLLGIQGKHDNDDVNEDIAVVPGGDVVFKNKLSNDGNESDTYTLNLAKVNDSDLETDDTDEFEFSNLSSMTVEIYNDSDEVNPVETKNNVNNGDSITLKDNQFAIISYTATAPNDAKGGESDTLTLSATSTKIQDLNSSKATLKNESQALVKLPVFKIEKTASTSNINLNQADATFNYVIEVTNDENAAYSTDADNILVQDKLPEGLIVKDSADDIIVSSDNTNTGQASISQDGNQQVVSIKGADLKRGEKITITIPVKVKDEAAKQTLAAAGSVKNYADVYDNFDNTPVDDPSNADIHDSTNANDPTQKTHLPDEHDSTDPNQPGGDSSPDDDDQGNPGKVSFTERKVELTGDGTEELPPKATGNNAATYTHPISNKGNKAEKDLTFTITNNNGDKVKVKNVKYEDPEGSTTTLTPESDGSYKLPELPAGKTGKIIYDVETDEAAPTQPDPTQPNVPYSTTVTVKAAGAEAPTIPAKTDKTTVKTLDLSKKQALDADCDGVADDGIQAFADGVINAKPGNCIIYQITASNTFSEKAMTSVVVSDNASHWSERANYYTGKSNTDIAKVTIGTGTITEQPSTTGSQDSGAVKATFDTIAAGNQGQVQFSIKLKQ